MGKVEDFIGKFFDSIKRNQSDKVIKKVRIDNPDLAEKLDKIDKATNELKNYINNMNKS